MAVPLPWIAREGIVLAFIYAIGNNGVEISLPKLLGATVMTFVVYALLTSSSFPPPCAGSTPGLPWRGIRKCAASRPGLPRKPRS